MADNIDIAPETVKTADLGAVAGDSIMTLSEAEFAERIELGARKIESLETTAILQIASEAAKIHGASRYRRKEGGYAGYMKKRLGCSRSSGRIPQAESYSGLKRGALYKLAAKHKGLFKKAGAATIVDLQILDEILAGLPAAEISETSPAT
jgi:hypothetical protein